MFKLIYKLFRGKALFVFFSSICLIVMSLDGIVGPYFIGKFTDVLTEKQYGIVPLLLILWGVLLLLLMAADFFNSFFFGKIKRLINIELKDKVFKHSYHRGNSKVIPSNYVTTITADIKQIENDCVDNSMRFMYSIFQGVITFIFLLFANWKIGNLVPVTINYQVGN